MFYRLADLTSLICCHARTIPGELQTDGGVVYTVFGEDVSLPDDGLPGGYMAHHLSLLWEVTRIFMTPSLSEPEGVILCGELFGLHTAQFQLLSGLVSLVL